MAGWWLHVRRLVLHVGQSVLHVHGCWGAKSPAIKSRQVKQPMHAPMCCAGFFLVVVMSGFFFLSHNNTSLS